MHLIRWLATVGAVGLISIFLSERGAIDPIQNLSLTASAPLQGAFRGVATPLNNIYDGIADRGELVEENQALREQVEALQAQIAAQQDSELRILELEDALGVKADRPDDQLLAASVLAQEPSGLKRMIAIDRGRSDGVDEGMVVLSRSGSLVGTVSHAFDDYAWIRLITDPDSSVNAQVNITASAPTAEGVVASPTSTPAPDASPAPPAGQPQLQAVRGVAEGDLRESVLLDLLPSDVTISEGALVLTSGLGGNYPAGVLIGAIDNVEQRPQSPFTRATLEPSADLSSLETVLVIVSFKPARLTSP